MKPIALYCLLLILPFQNYGQTAIVSGGGSFSSLQGKVSFSLGQISDQFIAGDNSSVQEGIQQSILSSECDVDGGIVTTDDPRFNLCLGDGEPNFIQLELTQNQGLSRYGIADATTLDTQGGNSSGLFNMENYPPGSYFLGHVSYQETDFFQNVGNVDDFEGCFDISNLISVSTFLVDGGVISTADSLVVCVDDGIPSTINFDVEGNFGPNFVWAILNQGFTSVVRSNKTGIFRLESLNPGTYKVVHAAYGDNVNIGQVDPQNIEGCINISNILTLQLVECDLLEVTVFPNPVSDQAQISFIMSETTSGKLEIFDALGRAMEMVFEGQFLKNEHYRFTTSTESYPNGVYFCRITLPDQILTEKFLVNN